MEHVITRLMYCSICEQAKRPLRGDYYVVNDKDFYEVYIDRKSHMGSEKGLTPHFIEYIGKSEEGMSCIKVLCSMHECGIVVAMDKDGKPLTYDTTDRLCTWHEDQLYVYEEGFWEECPNDTILRNKAYVLRKPRNVVLLWKEWTALKKSKFKLL